MAGFMKDFGFKIICMAKVDILGMMGDFMRACTSTIKNMDMENINGQMEEDMKVAGKTGSKTGMENTSCLPMPRPNFFGRQKTFAQIQIWPLEKWPEDQMV